MGEEPTEREAGTKSSVRLEPIPPLSGEPIRSGSRKIRMFRMEAHLGLRDGASELQGETSGTLRPDVAHMGQALELP